MKEVKCLLRGKMYSTCGYVHIDGNEIGWATMENSVGLSWKTKNRNTIWSSNPTPGHISRENDNSKRYTHPNVHCSTIYNNQDMTVCSEAKSCLTLCDPMDCNLPSSSVHGISQTRILKWLISTWTQPKCPSTEEWIKKIWYIYTNEYYSAIKMNEMWHLQRCGWT